MFCPTLMFVLLKKYFWPKICHISLRNYEMGAWLQNPRLVHNSTPFFWMFDMYVDFGPAFVLKFKFSIRFENVGKIWDKSPSVATENNEKKHNKLYLN